MVDLKLGFDSKWMSHVFFGVALAIGFLILSKYTPSLTLGIPDVPLSSVGEFFGGAITIFFAPIVEELVFRILIFTLLFTLLSKRFGSETSFYSAMLAQAALFAFFHYAAYTQGGYVSGSTPFIGAFIFGNIAQLVTRYRTLLSAMVIHSIINLTIFLSFVVVL